MATGLRFTILLVSLCLVVVAGDALATPLFAERSVYVAGFDSGNVIKFDLLAGTSEKVVTLAPDVPPGRGRLRHVLEPSFLL